VRVSLVLTVVVGVGSSRTSNRSGVVVAAGVVRLGVAFWRQECLV